MNDFDVASVRLPKWPAMVVRGENVTSEQAAIILVRTDSWRVSTNDREWGRQIRNLVGLKPDCFDGSGPRSERTIQDIMADIDHDNAVRAGLGALDLNYLHNDQIASCWVGGPHGWCHWDGRIGSDNYNIGKWPSAEEVLDEWRRIAEAFPFLRLTCQLYSGETCEENTIPLVEYVVAEGRASARQSSDRTLTPRDDLASEVMSMFTPGRERGCTLGLLEKAVAAARASLLPSEVKS